MYNIIFIDSITNDPNHINNNENINLGLYSLATVLNKYKYFNAQVVNFNQLFSQNIIDITDSFNENIENICNHILGLQPDIISLYTLYKSHYIALSICNRLKELDKNIKVMLGGPHATITARETLEKFPLVDAIGLGEGEGTIKEIIESLLFNRDLNKVAGIAYRKNNKIILNKTKLVNNLDDLPIIDYSMISNMQKRKVIPIDVGRGCPYSCTFCSTKTFWERQYRLKSPERILKEIKYLVKTYNIKYLNFLHDNFTCNKKRVIEFCNLLIKENLGVTFECSSRVDILDEELISKLSQAGCTTILLGIETGSDRMQKIIKKNLNVSKICDVIDMLKKYNIIVATSFIMGFPEETDKDVRETFKLIHELAMKRVNRIFCNKLQILPGSELFQKYKSDLKMCSNVRKSSLGVIPQKNLKIYSNSEIFPEYFEYSTKLREDLNLIQVVMGFFYEEIYKYFHITYQYIINYFKGDLLQFLYDFRDKNYNILISMCNPKYNLMEISIAKKINIIKKYIKITNFGKNNEIIEQFFKLEYNVYFMSVKQETNEKVVGFDIDVFKVLKDHTHNNISYPTKLKLIKRKRNSIRIEPVQIV